MKKNNNLLDLFDPFQQWQPTVSDLFIIFIIKLLHYAFEFPVDLMFYFIYVIYSVQWTVTVLDVRVHV